MSKYQTFEPGVYLDWEKPFIEPKLALAEQAPPKERSEPSEPVSAFEILQFNNNWEPYNPLFKDREYAKAAGYRDIFAFPGFRHPSDLMAVSLPHNITEFFKVRHGPNDVEMFQPIYPGDSFTTETEKLMFKDITTPGSNLRFFLHGSISRMYNQRDELVVRHTIWRGEAYKKVIDGGEVPQEPQQEPPAHYTTDDEWEYIKELWSKEVIRGKDTLYWEDVNVGDEPAWICSGPITYMDMAKWHGTMIGGMPSVREMVTNNQAAGLFRDRFGDYMIAVASLYGNQNIPDSRAGCYNDTCAKLITRLVTNYVGDAGFVTRIAWMFKQHYPGTRHPREGGEYLDKVPYMKGRECTMHPYTTDTCIAKAYVTDKYVNDKGEHIIDLVCWGETLDKRIIEVVPASAKLPSRGG